MFNKDMKLYCLSHLFKQTAFVYCSFMEDQIIFQSNNDFVNMKCIFFSVLMYIQIKASEQVKKKTFLFSLTVFIS